MKGCEMKPPATIVVATDFSDAARVAVERAVQIARQHQAGLTLVCAVEQGHRPNLPAHAPANESALTGEPVRQIREAIRVAADELSRQHGVTARGVVAEGRAVEAIAAAAGDAHAALIVLGPHNRRLGDLLYLGSTALGLARAAACPVLVVRNAAGAAYARCLAGVDFSPPSQRAVITAARLFPTAAITLLHAVPSFDGPMLFTPELAEAVRAAKASLREEAIERLAQAFPAGQPGQLDSAERRAVVESAAGALLHALESGRFDLVALGRDAKSDLGERVLGSVPANLLLHAAVDMLIVP